MSFDEVMGYIIHALTGIGVLAAILIVLALVT